MVHDLKKILEKAEQQCITDGVKLTQKRKNVLSVLLNSAQPLSAYDIAEHYKELFADNIPVMSVYRMLEFLDQEKLVHKLHTTNQYLACAHITCNHQHQVPQFLICDRCQKVSEVGVQSDIINQLKKSIESTGFLLGNQQLELHGLCEYCQQ